MSLETTTALVMEPEASLETVPMMDTVALSPAGMAPRLQVRVVVLMLQEPWLGEKETPSSSTGRVSVTTTDWASEGPLLETRIS